MSTESRRVGAATSTLPAADQPNDGADLPRPRVLLVEDNQTNQKTAVRMLEILGYPVDVALNGLEAVQACGTTDYGIVLMDNQMPEMDGLTATREVRKVEAARGRPPVTIIALTANALAGDREKCLAAGMNDYLSKPVRLAQLRSMLERWRHLSRAVDPAPTVIAAAEEKPIDTSVFDVFRGAGGGASDFIIRLVDQYLAESTVGMAALAEAVERGDAPAVRLAAHTLKGASSAVGANRLAGICDDLEQLARAARLERTAILLAALRAEFERVGLALRVEQKIGTAQP